MSPREARLDGQDDLLAVERQLARGLTDALELVPEGPRHGVNAAIEHPHGHLEVLEPNVENFAVDGLDAHAQRADTHHQQRAAIFTLDGRAVVQRDSHAHDRPAQTTGVSSLHRSARSNSTSPRQARCHSVDNR